MLFSLTGRSDIRYLHGNFKANMHYTIFLNSLGNTTKNVLLIQIFFIHQIVYIYFETFLILLPLLAHFANFRE